MLLWEAQKMVSEKNKSVICPPGSAAADISSSGRVKWLCTGPPIKLTRSSVLEAMHGDIFNLSYLYACLC